MTTQAMRFTMLPACRLVHEKWRFCLIVVLAVLATACWPDGLAHLRYDRSAMADGEVWRIVTAHLVHLNTAHLLLNLLGLLLLCELQWGELQLRHGFGLFAFSAAAISAALWWLHPALLWYAGLSGVLHGLWSGCVLYGLWSHKRSASRLLYWGGALLLALKLAMESLFGASESTAHLIGGGVVTASHLYGALAGAVYVLALRCAKIRLPSRGALQQQ
jgi:rhomboid family GlyGly-CTERM serine protease